METGLTQNETLIEDGHAEPDQNQDIIDRHQQCFADIVTGIIGACVKNRVLPLKDDLHAHIQNVEEFVAGAALDDLPQSYTAADVLDEDSEVVATRAHDAIVDALRLKPIDWTGLSSTLFRAHMPTNPATLAAKGETL